MDELVRLMALAAHEEGVTSERFHDLREAWIEALSQVQTHRPPVQLIVHQNGIAFHLQSVNKNDYRYVPLAKYVHDDFAYNPETPRERILREFRIGFRALQEIVMIEAGQIDAEEGVDEE